MSSKTLDAAAGPPETLPGLELMGFVCCKCGEATLGNKLGKRCFDDKCGHERCVGSCQVFDRAGRLWRRQFAVPISWVCTCGRAHSVVGSLASRLTRPVCPCRAPAFLALYNTTGRLCNGLTIKSPFTVSTADHVTQLLSYLESTPWGSCIKLERETHEEESMVAEHTMDSANQAST